MITSSPGSTTASSVDSIASVDPQADGDLRRVHLHAVALRKIASDRLAQILGAPGDRVLVDISLNRGARRVFETWWVAKSGKPLREIDGVELLRQPGHFPDDRLGELRSFPGPGFHLAVIIAIPVRSTPFH
jgi:hypothetical protein